MEKAGFFLTWLNYIWQSARKSVQDTICKNVVYKKINLFLVQRLFAQMKCTNAINNYYNSIKRRNACQCIFLVVFFLSNFRPGSIIILSHVMRKPAFAICEQQRRRSACAFAQSDQRICYSLLRQDTTSSFYIQNFKPLACLYAVQAGLSLTWSQTPKTGFLVTRLMLW